MLQPHSRSPLYHWHLAHGARFTDCDGWQVPAGYGNSQSEEVIGRNGIGIADVSHAAKLSVQGRGVPAFANSFGDGGAVKPLGVSSQKSSESVLACRLTEFSLLLLGDGPSAERFMSRFTNMDGLLVNDVTCAHAGITLIGGLVDDVLRSLTSIDVSPAALRKGSCAETTLAGAHALLVRPPTLSVPEITVYVAWDVGEYVWESFMRAGRGVGIIPLGQDGLTALRTKS